MARILKKSLIAIALLVLTGYCAVVLHLFLSQKDFIYIPDRERLDPREFGAAEMNPVIISSAEDIILEGWHQPPSGAGYPTIVYFHGAGNAVQLAIRYFKARLYLEEGYGFLVAGYRGFSGNTGAPSEDGLYKDAAAWMQWLTQEKKIPEEKIILYGQSLGTGVATEIAARFPSVAAIVLESPFTSMTDVAAGRFPFIPVRILLTERFDSFSRIASVRRPLLVLHGEKDIFVPHELGRKLYERANDPKKFISVKDAGHADLEDFGAAAYVISFLKSLPDF